MTAWHVDQRRSRHGVRLSAWSRRADGVTELVTVVGRDALALYREAYAEIQARTEGTTNCRCTIVRAP